jgi:hypothetical protein
MEWKKEYKVLLSFIVAFLFFIFFQHKALDFRALLWRRLNLQNGMPENISFYALFQRFL